MKRKRRTREHVIADLSVNHVERLVLRCGWTVEQIRFDYGLDLMMRTYGEMGAMQDGWILMQLKATDSMKTSSDGTAIPVRLEWRDLLSWVNESMPVILILYDAAEDRAFWLHVQEYFRQRDWAHRVGTATTVTIHVPTTNTLDESAIRLFARLRLSEGGAAW